MKIAVVGMGLIGGSLLKAAEAAGFDVVGLHHGDNADLSDRELIFAALPPRSIKPWIDAHEATFKEGAILVD
ncbi:MAG: hypothetical protein J6P80_00255, partial [Kiritimatiellae bacterium]|nr:hypothetical protein [Kiritimatiellia bacterium]